MHLNILVNAEDLLKAAPVATQKAPEAPVEAPKTKK
jgi:hypothetical protein